MKTKKNRFEESCWLRPSGFQSNQSQPIAVFDYGALTVDQIRCAVQFSGPGCCFFGWTKMTGAMRAEAIYPLGVVEMPFVCIPSVYTVYIYIYLVLGVVLIGWDWLEWAPGEQLRWLVLSPLPLLDTYIYPTTSNTIRLHSLARRQNPF